MPSRRSRRCPDRRRCTLFQCHSAHHGAAFRGFVINEGINSVEGLLTDAISTVARHRVHIDVAGRTDAGVHARGQVITVDIPAETRLPAFVRSVNALCKPNVAVSDPEWVSNEFDARYSAIWARCTISFQSSLCSPKAAMPKLAVSDRCRQLAEN